MHSLVCELQCEGIEACSPTIPIPTLSVSVTLALWLRRSLDA